MALNSFRADLKWAASSFAVAAFLMGQGSAQTTVTFPPSGVNFTYEPSPYSLGGVTFTAGTGDNLYIVNTGVGSGHYGADPVLSSQGTSGAINEILITLPSPTTFASVIFNGFVYNPTLQSGQYSGDPVTVEFFSGSTEVGAAVNPQAGDGSYNSVTISDTVQLITSIELTDPSSFYVPDAEYPLDVEEDATLNLEEVAYGATTPEPSSISLMTLGLFALAGAAAYRGRLQGLLQAR